MTRKVTLCLEEIFDSVLLLGILGPLLWSWVLASRLPDWPGFLGRNSGHFHEDPSSSENYTEYVRPCSPVDSRAVWVELDLALFAGMRTCSCI